MLQTQLVDLKFLSGADTKTDDANTLYTSFREMKNSRMDQVGAILPRGGFSIKPLVAAPTYPAFDIVSTADTTVYGGNAALSLVGATNIPTGTLITNALRGELERIYGGDALPGTVTMTSLNNSICVAWLVPNGVDQTSLTIGLLVFDAVTGRVDLKTTYSITNPILNIRLCTWNSTIIAVVVDASFDLSALQYVPNNLLTPFTSVSWTGRPTGTTAMRYAVVANATAMYVAFAADNSNNVSLAVLTGAPNSSTNTTVANVLGFTNSARCLAITLSSVPTTTVVIFAGCNGVEAKNVYCSAAGAALGTPVSAAVSAEFVFQRMSVNGTSTTNAQAYFSGRNTTGGDYAYGTLIAGITTGSGQSGSPYPSQYLTGPIKIDSASYAVAETMSDPSYGSQALTIAGNSTRVGGFGASANVGIAMDTELLQLPNPVTVGTRTFFSVPMVTAITALTPVATGSTTFQTVGVTPKIQATVVIHDTSEHPQTMIDTSNQQNLYLGATQNQLTARERGAGVWPELSFHANDISTVSPGGFVRAAGVVSYVFAKLWRSADGLEYRTYSAIYTATTAANSTMQVRPGTMNFQGPFSIDDEVLIEQYRTEVNGTIFYLANTFQGPWTPGLPIADLSVDGSTGILKGRLADINAGELAPEIPQSSRLVTPYKDRIAMVSPDKPNTVLFNRPAPYPTGTSFASGLEVSVSQAGGNLTGMVQMDSALYLFKSNSVYTLYGDAPGATGEGSTLTIPQIVFDGTGCTDPRSVLLTPKGVIFKSGKGFYLIARNQQLEFVGAGPYTDNAFKVTGATITETQYEVMFAFSNGSVWVLNMDTGAWYEWICPLTPRAICSTGSNVTLAVDTGVFTYSTAATFDQVTISTTAPIAQDLTTGWFRMNNIRGFQRVKRLYLQGDVLEACTVTIDVYMDYKDVPVMTKVLPVSILGELEIDLHMEVQKGEAMSFRIRTDKYGIKLSGATLEIGRKDGTDKSRTSGSNPS